MLNAIKIKALLYLLKYCTALARMNAKYDMSSPPTAPRVYDRYLRNGEDVVIVCGVKSDYICITDERDLIGKSRIISVFSHNDWASVVDRQHVKPLPHSDVYGLDFAEAVLFVDTLPARYDAVNPIRFSGSGGSPTDGFLAATDGLVFDRAHGRLVSETIGDFTLNMIVTHAAYKRAAPKPPRARNLWENMWDHAGESSSYGRDRRAMSDSLDWDGSDSRAHSSSSIASLLHNYPHHDRVRHYLAAYQIPGSPTDRRISDCAAPAMLAWDALGGRSETMSAVGFNTNLAASSRHADVKYGRLPRTAYDGPIDMTTHLRPSESRWAGRVVDMHPDEYVATGSHLNGGVNVITSLYAHEPGPQFHIVGSRFIT